MHLCRFNCLPSKYDRKNMSPVLLINNVFRMITLIFPSWPKDHSDIIVYTCAPQLTRAEMNYIEY